MKPKLSIVMAGYDDYNGAWYTLQALRMYHDLSACELVYIDNHPHGPNSLHLKHNIEDQFHLKGNLGARYIAAPEIVGTSAPRDRAIEEATGEAILCIDSHVFLWPGSVARLIKWYADHPKSMDLISGPMTYDELDSISTHFIAIWEAEMWGQWGQAWETPCKGKVVGPKDRFSVVRSECGRFAQYLSLDMENTPLTSSYNCGVKFPEELIYEGHERTLMQQGFKALGYDPDDEFEIPGQGLGLFSCRKEAWLGFNPHARGFGGEEMYIHEKFRKAGRKCLCLGFLRWVHQFHRSHGVRYPLTVWNKARNYVLEFLELERPLDEVYNHFVKGRKVLVPQVEWDALIADPLRPMPPKSVIDKANGKPETVDEIFEVVSKTPRDLNQHFPKLVELASKCDHITEISKRRETFVALAAGHPKMLVSYNLEMDHPMVDDVRAQCPHYFIEHKKSEDIPSIGPTDMLWIHSTHTKAVLADELQKYGKSVSRFIVVGGTAGNGKFGADGGPGLIEALKEFVEGSADPYGEEKWYVAFHNPDQYGITVLACRPEDKPDRRYIIWPVGYGPGTEMFNLLIELGAQIDPKIPCDCNTAKEIMDALGVEGCRANKAQMVELVKKGYERWGWKSTLDGIVEKTFWEKLSQKTRIAVKAYKAGIATRLSPTDPVPGLVDVAIERAEEKELAKKKKGAA